MSAFNMVNFDTDELLKKVEASGYSMQEVSEMIGMCKSYLSSAIRRGSIDLKMLTKTYEVLAKAPKTTDRRAKRNGRYFSRNYLHLNGKLCRDYIKSRGYNFESMGRALNISGRALGTWCQKDYIPDNILPELAAMLDVDPQRLLIPDEPEQMELSFEGEETGEALYTAQEVKEIMQKFVSDFSDRIMDYLGETLGEFGEVD